MKYFIIRFVEGNFSSSPDVDYLQISEEECNHLSKYFRGRWKDTKEQAEKVGVED